jgi:predicted PurR-regulated permease PerM
MKSGEFTKNTIEASIRLGLLLLLTIMCFKIITPFVVPVLWGVIIAVAIYPVFTKLKAILGGRNKLASVLYTLIALALLMTPTIMVSSSLIDTATAISDSYEADTLDVPPPSDKVKDWPLIGEKTYKIWTAASINLKATLNHYKPQLKETSKTILSTAAGIGGGILQFVLSIIISGILVANASAAQNMTRKIFSRLTDAGQGQEYTDLSKATIRSVAIGVLGVAAIQAVLSALGMMVMDVPAWGLWSLIIMVLAIAQLPPLVVLGFVIAYVFSVAETTPAIVFAIYCLIISASDGFLKPLFLGRGMSTPMLVILLGAIGGMMMSGIIGLFVGAIVLALGYELFLKWLNDGEEPEAVPE